MTFLCEICKGQFTSEYLLNKHQNRKNPCDVVFECIRCKKILVNQYSLEKHYNKKNPCIEVPKYIKPVKSNIKKEILLLEKKKEIELEIQKEKAKHKEEDRKFKLELLKRKEEETRFKMEEERKIKEMELDALELEVRRADMIEFEREQLRIQLAAEKTKQIELKAQMQREKIQALKERKDLEYARAYQKTQNHMTSIKLYAENNEKKLEKKKEVDLEILKAKTESRKTIEVMKNERKEQTPQIINNNVTINNINICINYIKENHLDKLNIDFDQVQSTALEYLKQNVISQDEIKSAKHLIYIFEKYDTCNGILDHIIRMAYNNLEREDKRCIWYMKDPEYYFAGTIKDNEKNVKLIDFDKHLFPLIKPMLSTTVVKMTDMVTKYVKMGCNYEEGGTSTKYMKHQNLLYYQRNVLPFNECLSDIKNMSDKVFEIKSPTLEKSIKP
jgi:hypothetical protein